MDVLFWRAIWEYVSTLKAVHNFDLTNSTFYICTKEIIMQVRNDMQSKVKHRIVYGNIHRESKYLLMEHCYRQLTLWYVDQYLSTRMKILFEKSYIHRPKLLFFKYIFLFTMWKYFFHLELTSRREWHELWV